jgi:hypothetical protein
MRQLAARLGYYKNIAFKALFDLLDCERLAHSAGHEQIPVKYAIGGCTHKKRGIGKSIFHYSDTVSW